MSAGLFRIESAGLADSGGFFGRPAARLFNNKLLWLSVVLVVAAGAWKMFSSDAGGRAESQTVRANFAKTECCENFIRSFLDMIPQRSLWWKQIARAGDSSEFRFVSHF